MTWIGSLSQEDPLEEGMTTHSSILAWETPWAEDPGGLQSMGSQRAGHDLVTKLPFKFNRNTLTFFFVYLFKSSESLKNKKPVVFVG